MSKFRDFFVTAPMFLLLPFLSSTAVMGASDFNGKMKSVLKEYLSIQAALADDKIEGIATAAAAIGKTMQNIESDTLNSGPTAELKNLPQDIKMAAKELSQAKDIKAARESFKGLSNSLMNWANTFKPEGIDVLYCPMAKANWLQKSGATLNPYYGKDMLSCGVVVKQKATKKDEKAK